METYQVLITPDIAKEMLEKNVNNRNVRKSYVSYFKREIQRGNFITTHQGIAFNKKGELVDGQHRLLGIVEANMPVTMLVTYGVPDETYSVTDDGHGRDTSDRLKNVNVDPRLTRKDSTSFVKSFLLKYVGICAGTSKKSSIKDLSTFLVNNEDALLNFYPKVLSKGHGSNHVKALLSGSLFAAYLCGVDLDVIEAFTKCYTSNAVYNEFGTKHVLDLRDYLRAKPNTHTDSDVLYIENVIDAFANNYKRLRNVNERKYADAKNYINLDGIEK